MNLKTLFKKFNKSNKIDKAYHDDNLYHFKKYNHKLFGKHSYHGSNLYISNQNSRIGNFCSISNNVCIGVGMHPTNWLSTHPFQYLHCFEIKPEKSYSFNSYKECIIGNDVWIGRNVIIMDGITISDGAIIASGAVVTQNVSPYAIVGGVPAKIIKYRFSQDIVEQLLNLKWWDLNDEEIKNLTFNDIDQCIKELKSIRRKDDAK